MTTHETSTAAWLMTTGRVLASAEIASSRQARRRGLLGRTGLDGAFVIERCRWVHTIGMKFTIDVAYLDSDGVVTKTVRMHRHRIGAPVMRSALVIEASAGSFARWGIRVGDRLEIRSSP